MWDVEDQTKENKWQLFAVFRNGLSDVAIVKHGISAKGILIDQN
jgi:hypothetical protein